MVLTKKGKKVFKNMLITYKTNAKTTQVFRDMIAEGKLSGVERKKKRK